MLLVQRDDNAKIVRIGDGQMSLIHYAVATTLDSGVYLKPDVKIGLESLLVQMAKIYNLG